jgi:cell division protein FtsW
MGLGHSRQKYNYLPETISDSIFAIISEELGLIGALILITLFVILALRGFKIAKNAPDDFGKLVDGGITFWIVFQAFMNIMAITGLMPLTGIPLPFISYGGSALVVSFIAMGILLNISKYTKQTFRR